jgi:hypothetical protein
MEDSSSRFKKTKSMSIDYLSTSSAPTSPTKSSKSSTEKKLSISLPPAPNPELEPAAFLRSIYAVRQRCQLVMEKARKNELIHFDVDTSKFQETARYVVSIIKVCQVSHIFGWVRKLMGGYSETLDQTIQRYHPTAAGSTLISAVFLEYIFCCNNGSRLVLQSRHGG